MKNVAEEKEKSLSSTWAAGKPVEEAWDDNSVSFIFCGRGATGQHSSGVVRAESIPCRILVNQLRAIPEQGLWALWRERLLFMVILLLYLMIAARCLWGNLMIPVALVLYGIGQGIVVSFLLMLVGLGGIGYILLGILLPRTVQLVALILMCNLAHSRCEQMSGAEGGGQAALWILSGLLLAVGGILEAIMKAKMVISVLR